MRARSRQRGSAALFPQYTGLLTLPIERSTLDGETLTDLRGGDFAIMVAVVTRPYDSSDVLTKDP